MTRTSALLHGWIWGLFSGGAWEAFGTFSGWDTGFINRWTSLAVLAASILMLGIYYQRCSRADRRQRDREDRQ